MSHNDLNGFRCSRKKKVLFKHWIAILFVLILNWTKKKHLLLAVELISTKDSNFHHSSPWESIQIFLHWLSMWSWHVKEFALLSMETHHKAAINAIKLQQLNNSNAEFHVTLFPVNPWWVSRLFQFLLQIKTNIYRGNYITCDWLLKNKCWSH